MEIKIGIILEIEIADGKYEYQDELTNAIIDQINKHTGLKKDKVYIDDFEIVESEIIKTKNK